MSLVEENSLNEHILLVVPARPEMWAIVRVTASAIATRLDFSFEDVEDLRLAVTEMCGSCANGADIDSSCECRFDISEERFEMHCQVSPVGEIEPKEDEYRLMSTLELSQQILEATVDRYTIDSIENGMRHGYLCKGRGSEQPK
jgi:serine/threonine-protein kinase RsbW